MGFAGNGEGCPMTLVLCDVAGIGPLQPAVLYEKEAARYLRMDIHKFRMMVNDGIISCRAHAGGKRHTYLRDDLDAYLQALPLCNNPAPAKVPQPRQRKEDSHER